MNNMLTCQSPETSHHMWTFGGDAMVHADYASIMESKIGPENVFSSRYKNNQKRATAVQQMLLTRDAQHNITSFVPSDVCVEIQYDPCH